MALPKVRRSNQALVASASRPGASDSQYAKRQTMSWQRRALQYIDLVPELNFASRFYSRMLKPVRLFPATLDDNGGMTPITSGPPVDLLNRIQDPGGGRSLIQSSYGRLMFTAGEGSLFGRHLGAATERWAFVWNDELEVETDFKGNIKAIHHKIPGGQDKVYPPDQAVVYRMWTPHPRNSFEADSPMRSILDVAEELITLTHAVMGTAVSRLTNGILFMPSEVAPPPPDAGGDEDPLNDPFYSDVAEYFSAQVENPNSAEARVPIIEWVNGDMIEKIRHLKLHDPTNDYMERDLRKEAIERMALGLDMPPETLKGMGGTNHWASMQIMADQWKSHGLGVAMQLASDLAEVYLRPGLAEMGYADWKQVVIGVDGSQVTVRPDRSDDADAAIQVGAIGWDAYRELKSLGRAMAPSDKERSEIRDFIKGGRITNAPSDANPSNGPPPPGPEGDSGRKTRIVASAGLAASARELGAIEMSLMRCRELAGARLRNKEKMCPECLAKAENQPLPLVAAAVGEETVKNLDMNAFSLVQGGTDTLRFFLDDWGWDKTQVSELCSFVEVYAASTLFDPETPSLPIGFMAQIEQMKEKTVLGESVRT